MITQRHLGGLPKSTHHVSNVFHVMLNNYSDIIGNLDYSSHDADIEFNCCVVKVGRGLSVNDDSK